jgi:NodT family efflux transporter outer membrane factor (OMF) lipoprotein
MPPLTEILRHIAASVSMAALSACAAVGPNFKSPEGPKGPAAAGYAMASDLPAPGAVLTPESRAAGPWWLAFGSADLDRVIRQALADSPNIAEARANLEKANAEFAATRGARLPQADLNGRAQHEKVNLSAFGFSGFPGLPTFKNPEFNLYQIGGAVSYDLDLFGGRRRAAEAYQARALRAAHEADAAYLSLSGNVALQAMKVASLRAQITSAGEVVAADRRVIEMLQQAEKAGGAARPALTGGVSRLAEDEALLPPMMRDLDAARHQLALLVGKSPAEWTAPDFDLAGLDGSAVVPVSLPSDLIRHRPDILAAETELHAATAEIGVAVADQYPDIRLSADLTQSAIKPESLFKGSASGFSLAGGLTAPLFNGGMLKAKRQVAEAEARAAEARYRATVLRAFVQVSDAMANLASDQRAIDSLKQATAAAEVGARDAQNGYRLGGVPLMDVVQANRRLSRAHRYLAEALGRRYMDLVTLYAATAADWRTGG